MIVSDAHETTIHTTTSEDINNILASVHEVDYDRLLAPKNKLIPTGDTDQSVYR